jgi:hypothetical protein
MLSRFIRRMLIPGLCLSLMTIGIAFGQSEVYLPVIASGQPAPTEQETPEPTGDEARAIALVAAYEPFALMLVAYPEWTADAYMVDEAANVWYVDFYDRPDGDWIAGGNINLDTEEIFDWYAPRDLTPAEFQVGQALIEAFLIDDAEILARQGNPADWGHDVTYNKWESQWEVYYWYGLDAFVAVISISDEEEVWLNDLVDPNALSAEQEARHRRDQAIELAWQADGIDVALDQIDNWTTYVEAQDGDRYTVAFVGDGQHYFVAYVDIGTWTVLEAGPPGATVR